MKAQHRLAIWAARRQLGVALLRLVRTIWNRPSGIDSTSLNGKVWLIDTIVTNELGQSVRMAVTVATGAPNEPRLPIKTMVTCRFLLREGATDGRAT